MDQLKDIMKQAVKYRFWIALGFSALLPLIGYLVGVGPIQKNADDATKKIEASAKDVANFTQPNLPNNQYVPLVKAKTEVVSKDVGKAWEKLYAVQAPLLKWPEQVEDRFQAWGRKWPENVDKGAVQKVISEYIQVYPSAVDSTYAMVNPWDPMEGTGVVVVPEKAIFLQPAVFDEATPPELGKIWAAQERLWIQGTLLSAIAKINGSAKTWDAAVVKQVSEMIVGLPQAQDQKSAAKGETVEAAPSLSPDGATETAAPEPSSDPMAMYAASRGGSATTAVEDVYHIKTDSQQYTIMPVKVVALVDQNRLQEYLIGLENSPMSIQVMEFELSKPMTPVTKPVKGEMPGGMGMGMGMGMMGSGGMEAMMRAYQSSGMNSGMSGYPMGSGMGGGYPSGGGMPGMMGGAAKTKSGTDVRSKDPKKEREAKEKARRERARATDMYYDIVEVTVYGQARFYNPPSAAPAADASESETADPAKPATVENPAKTDALADPGAPTPAAAKPAAAKAVKPAKAVEAPKPVEPAKAADTTTESETESDEPAKPADAAPKSVEPAKPANTTKGAAPVAPSEPAKTGLPKS